MISEVFKRIRVVGDGVSELEFGIEFTGRNTGLQVEAGVSEISLTSGENHSGDVGVEHSLLDVLDTREEQHGKNGVNTDVDVVLGSVVSTGQSLSGTVSVVKDVVLDVSVENESLIVHHLKLVQLGMVLRLKTEHLAGLVRVSEELSHGRALKLVEKCEFVVNVTLHGVLDEDRLLSLRVSVLGGVLETLLDQLRHIEVSVVVVHLANELSDRLSDLLAGFLDLLKDLLDLVFVLALQSQHVVNLLEGQLSCDEVVEVSARLSTRIPLVVFSHYIITKLEKIATR